MVLHIPFWNTSYHSNNYLTNVLVANLAHTFGFFSERSESLINIRKKVNILLFPKNHSYLSTDVLYSLCNYFTSSKNPVHRIITGTQYSVGPIINSL